MWMYERDEALEKYIPLENDGTDMWLSSQTVDATAGDTAVVTRVIKVNYTLNFEESRRVFWDRSPSPYPQHHNMKMVETDTC
jgi:hypothetical protein